MAGNVPPQKKRKVEATDTSSNKADLIFERFYKEYKYFHDFIHAFSQLIRGLSHALLPSVITSCDADSSNTRFGRSFIDCECEAVVDTKYPFHFGAFFKKGVDIYKCLLKKQVPEDRMSKDVASSLLMFLLEEEWYEELLKLEDDSYITGKTQVTVTLAEHLFKRLCYYSKEYVMDKHAKKWDICKCGKCKIQDLHFDDTSIGHPKVWHGSVDMMFEDCRVAVSLSQEEEGNESPGGRSFVEVKTENLDNLQSRNQVMAQTIVYSLLQRKRHPDLKHYLIPNIIANGKGLKFFFYDAVNDILMESKKYAFLYENLPYRIVLTTVIATWLVMNHRFLCSGPYRDYLQAPKSKFREHAEKVVSIYDDELQLRNLNVGEGPRPFSNWSNLAMEHFTFDWPNVIGDEPPLP